MFGGIVEAIGSITQLATQDGCKHFTIAPSIPFHDIAVGDSIAVNGVCLTVTALTADSFNMTAVPETLRLTNLDKLTEGSEVNLERSMRADARVSGHYVQGHVDTMGQVLAIENDNSDAL